MPRFLAAMTAIGVLVVTPIALADHIKGHSCSGCASHKEWPTVNGTFRKAKNGVSRKYVGTRRNDELLGHHGSDRLYGKDGSDILWGDWQGPGQPESQRDYISGGDGSDFIYGSHGRNTIYGGAGNDAISVHYGRGFVDCGPGRDIYHVPKSLKKLYRFRHCEKVDYRSEKKRGGGLTPLK